MPAKTVSEGMTNSYLVPALVVLVLGLASFVVSWILALPILTISIGLFASTTGVQINTDTKQYRTYVGFFGYNMGSWSSLSRVNDVALILSTERTTIKGIVPGAMPIGRSSTLQVRTYDVLLRDEISQFELNDFMTYKNARKTYDILIETLNISSRDYVAEKLAAKRSR